ncbi:MAG: GDP-mannose 4,6-dehydratase [Candidatus Wallbacteria bacterium]|nr:GDP-mannose 4,6-dehydratase [Candidatus Wallbacteria bacterium]
MSKKYLITGGAGFIGSHLSERLVNEGHFVQVLDDLSTGRMENVEHLTQKSNFKIKVGSVLDKVTLEELVQEAEVIVHLAAAVGVKYIMDNPLKSLLINIRGTENILELANYQKKLTLIASTSEVYGKNENIPLEESDDRILGCTYISRWGYACSKAVDEFLALAYFREKKLPVVIVRFFNTCGPRQTGSYGMVIPKFIKSAMLNQPITIFGEGDQSRCFTYINDVVEAMLRLLSCPQAHGEIINIGSTELVSINDLAERIVRFTGSSSTIDHIDPRQVFGENFEDMRVRKPDISKLLKLTGFAPATPLDEVLKKTIEYFEK